MQGKQLRKQCRAFLVRLIKRNKDTSHAQIAEQLLLRFDDLTENNREMLEIMRKAVQLLTARKNIPNL
jgi:CHASE3 domain sensor protein